MLKNRRCDAEIMDDPCLDRQRHYAALRGLARVNWVCGVTRTVWGPIKRLAAARPDRPLRVLDIATGSGDIPIGLWKASRRCGVELELLAVDISARALEFARRQADSCRAKIDFRELDVVNDVLPVEYDVLICSLFLHHLDNAQAQSLLRGMANAARRLVIVNDLVRGQAGLILAHAGTRLLTRCDVVHVDGPRSVRAAFTIAEARTMAAKAGMRGAVFRRRWPCRYLMTWERT